MLDKAGAELILTAEENTTDRNLVDDMKVTQESK